MCIPHKLQGLLRGLEQLWLFPEPAGGSTGNFGLLLHLSPAHSQVGNALKGLWDAGCCPQCCDGSSKEQALSREEQHGSCCHPLCGLQCQVPPGLPVSLRGAAFLARQLPLQNLYPLWSEDGAPGPETLASCRAGFIGARGPAHHQVGATNPITTVATVSTPSLPELLECPYFVAC